MGGYKLSSRADESLREIFEFSVLSFGLDQAKRHLGGLDDALIQLAGSPGSGRRCDDLLPGLRCSRYGRHAIDYRVDGPHIYVLDVLHQSMPPERHLPPDA